MLSKAPGAAISLSQCRQTIGSCPEELVHVHHCFAYCFAGFTCVLQLMAKASVYHTIAGRKTVFGVTFVQLIYCHAKVTLHC